MITTGSFFLFARLLRYHAAAVSRAIAQRTEFSNRAIESAIVVEGELSKHLGFCSVAMSLRNERINYDAHDILSHCRV